MQPKCGQKRKGRRFQSCEPTYIWMQGGTKELKEEPCAPASNWHTTPSFAFFVRLLHPGCFYRGISDGFVHFAPFSELEIQRELNLTGTDSLNRLPKSRNRCQV